ncbi:MAG: polymer-forming cytoskeletal protein [Candidatus Aminicenantes bacterium]|nr:polymer-forming cytoskeletal protein [Candidatus Aminicenantes bacterium]
MVFGSSKKNDKKMKDFTGYQYEGAPAAEEDTSTSFIGKKMKIEGEIFSEDDLIIEGQVKGTIEANKTLTIGRDGDVIADIHACVVKISGRVRGNITASDKVSILVEGRFNGNIKSPKLVVAEGAILIGDVNKEDESTKEIKLETEAKQETGKKHPPKPNNKKKSHTPPEKPGPAAEKAETEVIDAEIE